MSTKEKIVCESIKKTTKRISVIDNILNAEPLSDIIQLRKEGQKILDDNRDDNQKLAELIKPYAKKEKELFRIAKIQTDSTLELINEKVKLSSELGDLKNELYFIEQRYNANR